MKFYSHSYQNFEKIYRQIMLSSYQCVYKFLIHHTSDLTTYFIDDEHAT